MNLEINRNLQKGRRFCNALDNPALRLNYESKFEKRRSGQEIKLFATIILKVLIKLRFTVYFFNKNMYFKDNNCVVFHFNPSN